MAALFLVTAPLPAQDETPYKIKPQGHAQNKQRAATAYELNRKELNGDTNLLVRPGLVADKKARRVEVMVERTALGLNAPCEFTIVDESSDHSYEALLISFAKPSDVHQAIQFIGTDPGESFDPASLRYWPKGETFILSVVGTSEPPLRLEKLLLDRRTGKTLREDGFLFTGSRKVPALNDPRRTLYAADEYQPMSIASLFNSTYSVLEVPYSAQKELVYQNTIINPEYPLAEGTLLTLIIEPANREGSKRVKDLILTIEADKAPSDQPANDGARLANLRVQLKDGDTVLNSRETLISVIEALAALDRKARDYFVVVSFADNVELSQARALATILSTIDREKGIRIEPPPVGQLYYRALIPDPELMDREARLFHPWELALSEASGQVSGHLLLIESVWKKSASRSELEVVELWVPGPRELRKEMDAADELARKRTTRLKPPVIMVFAPSTLRYGQLTRFLEPVLPTHKVVHLYLDIPMPGIPKK
ncbi:MAG: hypothetical protein EXS36_03130 [Pedosphaera sp.]|nr:hypothetical protein [Pedosphaera sp.]